MAPGDEETLSALADDEEQWRVFEPTSANPNVREVIRWWERRRLLYNLLVIVAVILSVAVCVVAAYVSGQWADGEPLEFFGLVVGGILLLPLINLCYTFGWLAELVVRKVRHTTTRWFAPRLFAIGLCFAFLVVGAPAIGWAIEAARLGVR